jgi:hypothetical protein
MIWKRLRSGGPAALAELILIGAGVLLALAVDGWNDSRLDGIEEAGYLDRIRAELEDDTTHFNFILGSIDSKEASLLRLRSLLESSVPIPPDSGQFLDDLGQSANFGWNVGPLTRSASYEDLRSSGKLGLIRNPALRLAMVRYYSVAEGEDRRMEARKTAYPMLAYRVVPRRTEYSPELEPAFGVDAVRGLLAEARKAGLSGEIIAELNRARFVRGSITGLKEQAIELLGQFEAYSGSK